MIVILIVVVLLVGLLLIFFGLIVMFFGLTETVDVRKVLRDSSYRTGAAVDSIMCETCHVKPRDRYYPPEINLCRDCYVDETIRS